MDNGHKYRTILVFGAPGTGKGTQGKILGQIPGFVHVSCGDVFRSIRPNSKLGRIFLEYSSQGLLVPDDFTIQLWKDHIDKLVRAEDYHPDDDYLILDGIPRNLAQAQELSAHINVHLVINLHSSDIEALVQRMKRRALHENRLDDANEEVIRHRFEEYDAQTEPTLAYYNPKLIKRIDATGTPLAVFCKIATVIHDAVGN